MSDDAVDILPPEESRERRAGVTALWLMALLIAGPLYLGSLAWYGFDRVFARLGLIHASPDADDPDHPRLPIVPVPDTLRFEDASHLQAIRSQEEFLKTLLFTCEADEPLPAEPLHFRQRTMEIFTPSAMRSVRTNQPGGDAPDFALDEDPLWVGLPQRTCLLRFFRNSDGVLAYPPVLRRLAGPQEFLPARDGSVSFPGTIAVGDEYEVAWLPQPEFGPGHRIPALDKDNIYLDLGPLVREQLDAVASQAALHGLPKPVAVRAIRDFLEREFVYSLKISPPPPDIHPVLDFLTRTKTGHCQHIAGSFVALARFCGIGARVATGYLESRRDASGTRVFVLGDVGHAWPEVLTDRGWVVCDPSVRPLQRERGPAPAFALPDERQLQRRLAAGVRQNRGEPPREDEETPDSRFGDGARRQASDRWPALVRDGLVMRPDAPGTVQADRERQRAYEEAERAKADAAAAKEWWRWLGWLLLAVTATVLVVGAWKTGLVTLVTAKVLRFLLRLVRLLLFGPEPEGPAARGYDPARLGRLYEELQRPAGPDFHAKDLVRLFNEFLRLMAEVAGQPRLSSETAAEYLARVRASHELPERECAAVVTAFGAALYGRKSVPRESVRVFRESLRVLLQHMLARQAPDYSTTAPAAPREG
ncbi:MAG: transglutaminase domain-containing protein [Candidatus Riflebacteria bacterium]|nr:transglutaminase domain-containing protein [Candidatus Riflebacteria bacterium]